MYHLKLNSADKTPKYKQIIKAIITDIEQNVLHKNEQLPSLNELCDDNDISRDTVEKAYRELRVKGFITAVKGKGFYVNSPESRKLRILLIFNKLSSHKKIIYYSFLETFGDKASVDLQIHHYNARLFEEIINDNLGKYNYYVVMPMFLPEEEQLAIKTLERIPENQLLLLDKNLPDFKFHCPAVFQDFEKDVSQALEGATDLLSKYERLVLVFPTDANYPVEIIRDVRHYCNHYKKEFVIRENIEGYILQAKTIYLVVEETDLADLIKRIRQSTFTIGLDIGIISFNETTLKELLGITVITTNFEEMGKTAANLILEKKNIQVKNPYSMIRRGSI